MTFTSHACCPKKVSTFEKVLQKHVGFKNFCFHFIYDTEEILTSILQPCIFKSDFDSYSASPKQAKFLRQQKSDGY